MYQVDILNLDKEEYIMYLVNLGAEIATQLLLCSVMGPAKICMQLVLKGRGGNMKLLFSS